MGLPLLYAQPETPESWRAWSFNHASNHYDWISAAQDKQQTPTVLVTNAATAAGNNVLGFASTAALQVNGVIYQASIVDQTTTGVIPSGTLISGSNPTQIQMSENATGTGVAKGDSIAFTPTQPAMFQQLLLDPMDRENMGMWLYNHQESHNQINSFLGTSGYNLLDLDWDDPDQFALWLKLNGDEHTRISAALGLS